MPFYLKSNCVKFGIDHNKKHIVAIKAVDFYEIHLFWLINFFHWNKPFSRKMKNQNEKSNKKMAKIAKIVGYIEKYFGLLFLFHWKPLLQIKSEKGWKKKNFGYFSRSVRIFNSMTFNWKMFQFLIIQTEKRHKIIKPTGTNRCFPSIFCCWIRIRQWNILIAIGLTLWHKFLIIKRSANRNFQNVPKTHFYATFDFNFLKNQSW